MRFLLVNNNLLYKYYTRDLSHLALTENGLKFFDRTDLTNDYENTYIWWYEIIKINLFSQPLFEKTHISVILYYKIDHFCPLKSNFHPFPAIWPNVWDWNSLLPSYYHLLVQVRHARSLLFPLGTKENCFLKGKIGQFYSIKWLKYGFSQKGSDRIE